ncbi:hypothetical protein [Candidatus Nitronereus thalassa]|uniref:Uncharacterized protein n=1 Tax=Candidatus Nitronereus thalassa TaxID=3020898 RepID=A0ABU3KCU0_9BACT|nr:hypothetical protein [Candidatus Nitronereus thalassa]MDT7044123.1 hypothetical protein [Candidatus Nitronereus thalassa]
MNAVFYPFHLCQESTLHHLLQLYESLHFRDFMALQLTPLVGTTAFPDRMGDYYPELLRTGRIIQGHQVSGPMNGEMIKGIDRDLADTQWRSIFHEALVHDYRFQRGLFDKSKLRSTTQEASEIKSLLSTLAETEWINYGFQVDTIKTLSRSAHSPQDGPTFEYGWALLKTSASLLYTIQLCHTLDSVAVTDSRAHHQLLTQTCRRDSVYLRNVYLDPKDGKEHIASLGDMSPKDSGRAG